MDLGFMLLMEFGPLGNIRPGLLTNISCLFPAVNFICDHPAIRAISFVGSNQAGEYIYERGSRNGKRVQSNMVGVRQSACSFYRNWSKCMCQSGQKVAVSFHFDGKGGALRRNLIYPLRSYFGDDLISKQGDRQIFVWGSVLAKQIIFVS